MKRRTNPGKVGHGRLRLAGMVCAALLALSLPTGAQAQRVEPSFDCQKAATDTERLICADPELMRRDHQLATAYHARRKAAPGGAEALKAEQRAWLKQREAACGLSGRATADDLPREVVWRRAPCLAQQYADRLAALGAPLASLPSPLPTGALHPLCISAATDLGDGGSADGIDLTACRAGTAHIPVTSDQPDTYEADGAEAGWGTWAQYRRVGALPDGRPLVLSVFNGGGTGFFTLLSAISIDRDAKGGERLRLTPVSDGGDRCFGGITDVSVKGADITVSRNLTPAGLAELLKVPAKTAESLPDCAACCYGELTTRQSGLGDPALMSITLPAAADLMPLDQTPLERCFAATIARQAGTTLSGPALEALSLAVRACKG